LIFVSLALNLKLVFIARPWTLGSNVSRGVSVYVFHWNLLRRLPTDGWLSYIHRHCRHCHRVSKKDSRHCRFARNRLWV